MISAVFHAIIYDPLYNGLVFLVDVIPSHDVGLAVIALTILVRIILFPLSRRAVETQLAMKKIAPQVEALKVKYKDNREEQGKATFALYKEHGVHPFASFGLLLLQIPVLLALYWVFALGGLPQVDATLLYPFVHLTEAVNMEFLGFMNMADKSIVLAVLAAATQFVYTRLSMGPRNSATPIESTLGGDMAKSFDLQARYVLPVMVGVIAFYVSAAAPLYWVTSNIFMILQEYAAGRRFGPEKK